MTIELFANEITKTEHIPVSQLRADTVDVRPRDYSFSSENWAEMHEGGWRARIAIECEECHAVYVGEGPVECENTDCERFNEEVGSGDDGPMMNYWYPLPFDPSDSAIAELANLPLCVVYIDDAPGLALTGGGMDLSWEICEAFMRLGCLPPLHFSALPAICGRGVSKGDKVIAKACERSADMSLERMKIEAGSAKDRVKRALEFGEQHEEERSEREAKS